MERYSISGGPRLISLAALCLFVGTWPCFAEGMTGSARNTFVEETFKSCFKSQSNNPLNASLPASQIGQYCVCFANRLADKTRPEDLPELNRLTLAEPSALAARLHPMIREIGTACGKEAFK